MKFLRVFLINAAIAFVGVALAALELYPPMHDGVFADHSDGITATGLFIDFVFPGIRFINLIFGGYATHFYSNEPNGEKFIIPLWSVFPLSIGLYASTLGLVRRPAALIAAVVALSGFCVFFDLIYNGAYRHVALWLIFLVSLYWIAGDDARTNAPSTVRLDQSNLSYSGLVGRYAFVVLAASQVVTGAVDEAIILSGVRPESRSRDVASLIRQYPALQKAIIISDTDMVIEPLPYYVDNPTYLVREQRFGRYAIFTQHLKLHINLDDILATARHLQACAGQPVIMLMRERPDPAAPARIVKQGFGWTLEIVPEQVRRFQSATRLLASFPPALGDESYDVYVFEAPAESPQPPIPCINTAQGAGLVTGNNPSLESVNSGDLRNPVRSSHNAPAVASTPSP